MGRRPFRPIAKMPHEFELDLAPLLSVMMKLVPVMLISTAFVQVMMIESDLPQAVKEAIQQNEQKPVTTVMMTPSLNEGIKVIVQKNGRQDVKVIPMVEGKFDFVTLHKTLQTVKKENPEVFRIELTPDGNVPYREVVRMMDEARKSRDKDIKFPLFDAKENKTVLTDYMFPDIVFTNVFDG